MPQALEEFSLKIFPLRFFSPKGPRLVNPERRAPPLYTLEALVKNRQPEVYRLLAAFRAVETEQREEKLTPGEVEKLMRHDAYRRERGGLRQIRRG